MRSPSPTAASRFDELEIKQLMQVYSVKEWDAEVRFEGFTEVLKLLGVDDQCGPWLFGAFDTRKTGTLRWLEANSTR